MALANATNLIARTAAGRRAGAAVLRLCTAGLALLFLVGAAEAQRVALVIGNSAYQHTPQLPNPVRDAKAIEQALTELGFEVIAGYDLNKIDMEGTLARFARAAQNAELTMFFYAGHGMQVNGSNYLLPVDAQFRDELALDFEAVQMNFVLRQMERSSKVRIVLLDACRDNPLAKSFSANLGATPSLDVSSGLAEISMDNAGDGTIIAFATSPGKVAYDGGGEHSPFTAALLKHIDTPQVNIQTVLTRVTGDVYNATARRQRPWVNASVVDEVFLNEAPAPTTAQVTIQGQGTDTTADAERKAFEAAANVADVASLEAFLARYPDGTFAEEARQMIAMLGGTAVRKVVKGTLEIQPGDTGIKFDVPISTGPYPVNGKSLAQLIQGTPMFSPIEGLEDAVWKGKNCSSCHDWNKDRLCEQGTFYAKNEPKQILRKQHPYGGPFKLALRNWSQDGCK